MTTPARPARQPSRWDDPTCGVPGCRCPHNPTWTPSNTQPCDRGQIPARPGQTTPGVHGPGYHQRGGTPGEGAVAHCPTCQSAREARAREARQ